MQITAAAITIVAVVCTAAEAPSIHTLVQRDTANVLGPSTAAVSTDGRYVAFASYARLAPADTNSQRDVYVLDRGDGRVTLESVTPTGQVGTVDNGHPRISADGRFLVYETFIPSGPGLAVSEIVLRDRRDATVTIVSRGVGGARANGMSGRPAISQDGRVVVFSSAATNLVSGADANGSGEDVYLFDTRDRSISRISVDSGGVQPALGTSVAPTTSGDGRYVAFASTADLDGVGQPGSGARRMPGIFLRDRTLELTIRVDRAAGGGSPDGPSSAPFISADGRYVAFVSAATNITAADRNRSADVFLADLQTGSVELVSRNARSGSAANGPSGNPALSADGRFVAFQSEASDMLCARCTPAMEDINLLSDVFLLDRQGGRISRVSGDTRGGWMAPSVGPAVDGMGGLVVFSSRHPMDASDTGNDYDLFLCAAPSGSRGGGLLRESPDGLDHGHEPHAFSHRDVLAEDPLDDSGIYPGYLRWG